MARTALVGRGAVDQQCADLDAPAWTWATVTDAAARRHAAAVVGGRVGLVVDWLLSEGALIGGGWGWGDIDGGVCHAVDVDFLGNDGRREGRHFHAVDVDFLGNEGRREGQHDHERRHGD